MNAATRDYVAYRERRLMAAELFVRGERQADIARKLGVTRQSVNGWFQSWKAGGRDALVGVGRPGTPSRLTDEQWMMIEQALMDGPVACGFENDLWTLPRIAVVIERLTGVRYHPGHLCRLMAKLGWSPQKPIRRASERNEEDVRHWTNVTWPDIKKRRKILMPG